jgi:sugar (pentulose or hexulose) kinase
VLEGCASTVAFVTRAALIGIDLGTTHLKAAAFSPRGCLLARAARPTPTLRLTDGGSEYDPEALLEGVRAVVREVLESEALEVLGVGVTSMAEAGLLLGEDGVPRGNATAWFDPRSRPQANALLERFGARSFYRRSGLFPTAKHGLTKLLWQRDERGSSLERATWLHLAEFVAWHLTGERASCPTLAARTLLFDLERGSWDHNFLRSLDLPASLLPRLEPEGAVIGTTREGVFGLPDGIPVALAGHDHPCAALGAGVIAPGEALISTGTAEAVLGAMPAPMLAGAAFTRHVNQGPLPVPGLYALQVGASASGGGVEWLRRELLEGMPWTELEAMLEATNSPSGLLWLPHLAGSGAPDPEPSARGTLLGLTQSTTRAQIARAVLEGTALELRRLLEGLEIVANARFERIVVTGGHTLSAMWLQLKADALHRDLEILEMPEATLLGAAILASVAAGVYPDARAASSSVHRRTRDLEPSENAASLEGWFGAYMRLHATLQREFRSLPGAG